MRRNSIILAPFLGLCWGSLETGPFQYSNRPKTLNPSLEFRRRTLPPTNTLNLNPRTQNPNKGPGHTRLEVHPRARETANTTLEKALWSWSFCPWGGSRFCGWGLGSDLGFEHGRFYSHSSAWGVLLGLKVPGLTGRHRWLEPSRGLFSRTAELRLRTPPPPKKTLNPKP